MIGFFIVPFSFAAILYLIIALCLAPVLKTGANIFSLVLMETDPDFNYEPESVFFSYKHTGGDVKASEIVYPSLGAQYGLLEIESLGICHNLYYGDSRDVLEHGVGQFAGSSFPGEGSTVLIAGHNNRNIFNTLGDIEIGAEVKITTSYGIYRYRVTETKLLKVAEAEKGYDLNADYENLVLYTCYPFSRLGYYSHRFFVCCEFVSGPQILLDR